MPRRVKIGQGGVHGPGIYMCCNVKKGIPRFMRKSAISVVPGPKCWHTHSKAVMASTAKVQDEFWPALRLTGWIKYQVFPSRNVLGSIWTNPVERFRLALFLVLSPKTLQECHKGGHLWTANIGETPVWVDNALGSCQIDGSQWTKGLVANLWIRKTMQQQYMGFDQDGTQSDSRHWPQQSHFEFQRQ